MVPSRRWRVALAGAVVVLASCGGDNNPRVSSDGRISVVTTTTVVTDLARSIGGDRIDVYGVMKPNVDPHDYEPTPADLDAIAHADVIVKNGVGIEKWLDDTIASAEPKAAVTDASNGVTIRSGEDPDEPDGDPHIWHNPENVKIMARNLAAALEAADPSDTASYEQHLADYTAQLDRLDADIKAQLSTLTNKKLVTNHDAFGYYVDHFGLEFVGSVIPSFDTQAELSQQDINDLVARVKSEGVKAIFSESSLPPKTAEAIAKEAGVKVVEGDDALYGDGLGPDGSGAATYIEMMEHNTKVIVDNLR